MRCHRDDHNRKLAQTRALCHKSAITAGHNHGMNHFTSNANRSNTVGPGEASTPATVCETNSKSKENRNMMSPIKRKCSIRGRPWMRALCARWMSEGNQNNDHKEMKTCRQRMISLLSHDRCGIWASSESTWRREECKRGTPLHNLSLHEMSLALDTSLSPHIYHSRLDSIDNAIHYTSYTHFKYAYTHTIPPLQSPLLCPRIQTVKIEPTAKTAWKQSFRGPVMRPYN